MTWVGGEVKGAALRYMDVKHMTVTAQVFWGDCGVSFCHCGMTIDGFIKRFKKVIQLLLSKQLN